MINYVNDSSEPEWKGYFYAVSMFLSIILKSLFMHQHYHRTNRTSMRLRAALIGAVYTKVSPFTINDHSIQTVHSNG